MIIYPVEFQRRLEQKWGRRIDQIIAVTGSATPPRDPNDDDDYEDEGANHLPPTPSSPPGRVDEEVAHPHPSQTRMCRFPASGSSWESLARGGADDTIRDLPAEKDSR